MAAAVLPKGTDKLAFKLEWVDTAAALKRHYLMQYFLMPSGNQLELFDLKNHRVFLKKTPYPSVELDDLFIGAKVTIYARQMTVVDYGDEATRRLLAKAAAKTFGLVGAGDFKQLGRVIEAANGAGLTLGRLKSVYLTAGDAAAVGAREGGLTVGMELVGPDAHEKWAAAAAGFGSCVVAPSSEAGEAAIASFFGADAPASARESSAEVKDCATAVVLPHMVLKKAAGPVVDALINNPVGLRVSAIQLFDIDMVAAEEFLEVYKGVVPEYRAMAEQLSSGRFLVLELVGDNAVNTLREYVGPADPEVAGRIRKDTLRARFGVDRVRNGVHCTDLDEDGELESEYFFRILQDAAFA